MELTNQIQLELYFADHFDTILYSVLADIYLNQDDLKRARRVCEIGLRHHENDPAGLFVLAQVEKFEGNLKETELLLEKVLLYNEDHLAAAEMLCEIQTVLGRAQSKLLRSWQHVSKLDPNNQIAEDFIKKVKGGKLKKSLEPLKTNYDKKPQVSNNKNKNSHKTIIEKSTNPLNVSTRLATFTLVAVLKNQGLFEQALDVLEILEEKGDNKKKVQQERRLIQTLIKNSREV
tara:strand:+ start:32702 stop:33397 length:696 start_codon:yes stop_codon:yes gene_type:complete